MKLYNDENETGVNVEVNDLLELTIYNDSARGKLEYIVFVQVTGINGKTVHFKDLKIIKAPEDDTKMVEKWDVDVYNANSYRDAYEFTKIGDKTTHPEYFL